MFDIHFAVGEFLRIFGERNVFSGERSHGEERGGDRIRIKISERQNVLEDCEIIFDTSSSVTWEKKTNTTEIFSFGSTTRKQTKNHYKSQCDNTIALAAPITFLGESET